MFLMTAFLIRSLPYYPLFLFLFIYSFLLLYIIWICFIYMVAIKQFHSSLYFSFSFFLLFSFRALRLPITFVYNGMLWFLIAGTGSME